MTEHYLSVADIAEIFGVQPAAVHKWRERYDDFPAPDAMIGGENDRGMPGWLPKRRAELQAWHASRPGVGRPGQPRAKRARRDV